MFFSPVKPRRRSPRQWIAVPVFIGNGDGSRIEGVSINISEGGIYLFAAANLSLGSQLEVEFRLPASQETVRACGTVRRRVLYLYAIEFLRDSAASWPERRDGAERMGNAFDVFP